MSLQTQPAPFVNSHVGTCCWVIAVRIRRNEEGEIGNGNVPLACSCYETRWLVGKEKVNGFECFQPTWTLDALNDMARRSPWTLTITSE